MSKEGAKKSSSYDHLPTVTGRSELFKAAKHWLRSEDAIVGCRRDDERIPRDAAIRCYSDQRPV